MSDDLLARVDQLLSHLTTRKIWIFRKGNGLVSVHPSPALLKKGEDFAIVNTTNELATVAFPSGSQALPIDAGKPITLRAPNQITYVEYDVTVGGNYAEGASKPGAIIDP